MRKKLRMQKWGLAQPTQYSEMRKKLRKRKWGLVGDLINDLVFPLLLSE